MKKPESPLCRRYAREIRTEAGKYFVIFLLMLCSISLISGFLVADNSMLAAYEQGFSLYQVENGNFTAANRMNRSQRKDAEALGITVYDLFFTEFSLSNQSTMRFYRNRSQIDLACLMQGRLPQAPGETAIDRMYADNNALSVGDTLHSADGLHSWQITGLIALPDYSCLFQNNSDSMFDSVKFGVGVLCSEEFRALPDSSLTWRYAWKYPADPSDDSAEKELSDSLLESLGDIVSLRDFLPRYQNQAITFTGDDMGSDRAMMTVLLCILILIIAFVFTITISGTIRQESGVIGTLRAMGFTRWELVRHYMALPLVVTLVSALLGNILGYTVMKDYCASLYYGSYSLPTYVTLWNADAFLKTTLLPIFIMLAVNFFVLSRKLRFSPLQFLRHDLRRSRKARAFPLPPFLPFFLRFRLRILLQNLGSYCMIFLGVLFANLLLLFGMGLPDLLDNYTALITGSMPCQYQYMLTVPASLQSGSRKLPKMLAALEFSDNAKTDAPDAEKFSAASLKTEMPGYRSEDITLYGIRADSRYIHADTGGGKVAITSALSEKYLLQPGDVLHLREEYGSASYSLTITSILPYDAALYIYMSQEDLNRLLDYDADFFCGYFSDTPLSDLSGDVVGTVIDLDAMTKFSRQMQQSMGSMMGIVDVFALLIFVIVIYLLSKTILEQNAQSISTAKILGYSNAEIARLYILPTSSVVIFCLLVSLPLLNSALQWIIRYMCISELNGWIPYLLSPIVFLKAFLLGLASYTVVSALELRRIRRVPMTDALKNRE